MTGGVGLIENAVPVGWTTNVTSANDLMFSASHIRNEERTLTAQFCPGSVDILGTHEATPGITAEHSAKLFPRKLLIIDMDNWLQTAFAVVDEAPQHSTSG